MNFEPGQYVVVTRPDYLNGRPGWSIHYPNRFTGVVVRPDPIWPTFVLVKFDKEFKPFFPKDTWFCRPKWLQLVGGPW